MENSINDLFLFPYMNVMYPNECETNHLEKNNDNHFCVGRNSGQDWLGKY